MSRVYLELTNRASTDLISYDDPQMAFDAVRERYPAAVIRPLFADALCPVYLIYKDRFVYEAHRDIRKSGETAAEVDSDRLASVVDGMGGRISFLDRDDAMAAVVDFDANDAGMRPQQGGEV